MASSPQGGAAASANGSGAAQGASTGAKPGRKARDPNAVRKPSSKVKPLSEVRTYMIQHREQVLSGKTGVERDIEAERFDRMLDSLEGVFPPNHVFTIKRPTAQTSTPAAQS